MSFFRRLLKWVAALVALLALATLIFVWGVLGVSPFEGRVDLLCRLASSEVHFYVRFPGTQLLRQPLVQGLGREAGFEALGTLREELETLTREVARQANPQIPFGLFEVDFEKDFLGQEMAFAGTIENDYANLKLSHFLVMTRVKWYGRFLSAAKRQFVRERIPGGAGIDVEKGLYLRVTLDAAAVAQLNQFRVINTQTLNSNEIYLGRIGDVVLMSDNPIWIEHALQGGAATLPANAWFKSEFMRLDPSPDGVEMYAHWGLPANVLLTHGRPGSGSFLSYLEKLVPVQITGDLTVRAAPKGDDLVHLSLFDVPPENGFAKMPLHLQKLYHGEKGDLRLAFTDNGIGRFIPRERTVAAILLNARAEELVETGVSLVPGDEMRLIEDDLRSGGSRFTTLTQLLKHLAEDLADTHLVVIHRPSNFERTTFSTYRDRGGDWTPMAQLSYSIISRVREGIPPDKVRERLFRNLQFVGMESMGVDKESGKLHLARLVNTTAELELVEPAYGAMSGEMPYVVFSTSQEAAASILRAAEDPQARLVNSDGFAPLVARLPDRGTVGVLVNAPVLHKALLDRVRLFAAFRLDIPGHCRTYLQSFRDKGINEPSDEAMNAEVERYVAAEYPRIKDQYHESLRWMESLDSIAVGASLGESAEKKVVADAFVKFLLSADG